MKTIRGNVTLWLLLGLGGLCGLVSVISYQAIHTVMLNEFDYALQTKLDDLYRLTEHDKKGYEFEFVEKSMPEFEREVHPEYYEIALAGKTLARSPSLKTSSLLQSEWELTTDVRIYPVPLPGNHNGRVAVFSRIPLEGVDNEAVTIAYARDTDRLEHVFTSLATAYLIGTTLLLLLIVLTVKRALSVGLQPLDLLGAQATKIEPEVLGVRFISDPATPNELNPIIERLNELLERIEAAFQRERLLTSSLAHELNTPIAELRTLSEVALRWPEETNPPDVIAQAHTIALHMQALVHAQLTLTRCESGQQPIHREPVDVVVLLEKLLCTAEKSAQSKALRTTRCFRKSELVNTDRALLEAILANLLNNALEYTPDGGELECAVSCTTDAVEINLINTNNSLEPADLAHLFDPLWRKDPARTGTNHCGLGLAAVERFCKLLDIRISAALAAPDRFQIILTIPIIRG